MFFLREQTIYRRAKLIPHNEEDIVDDYKLKEDKDMKRYFNIKKAEIGDALLMLAFLLLMVYCILPMIWMAM